MIGVPFNHLLFNFVSVACWAFVAAVNTNDWFTFIMAWIAIIFTIPPILKLYRIGKNRQEQKK